MLQVTQQSKAHSYIRLNVMICQLLASQIASVVELIRQSEAAVVA